MTVRWWPFCYKNTLHKKFKDIKHPYLLRSVDIWPNHNVNIHKRHVSSAVSLPDTVAESHTHPDRALSEAMPADRGAVHRQHGGMRPAAWNSGIPASRLLHVCPRLASRDYE